MDGVQSLHLHPTSFTTVRQAEALSDDSQGRLKHVLTATLLAPPRILHWHALVGMLVPTGHLILPAAR